MVWDGTPERATAESLLYQELGLESGINPTPEVSRSCGVLSPGPGAHK